MTLAYQTDLLKVLLSNPDYKSDLAILTKDMFADGALQTQFEFLKEYHKDYNHLPSLTNFVEYITRMLQKQQAEEDTIKMVLEDTYNLYKGTPEDLPILKETLIVETKKAHTRVMMEKYMQTAPEASTDSFTELATRMQEIDLIGKANQKKRRKILFMSQPHSNFVHSADGHPTYIRGLNRMTNSNGFYTPQHIILMAGPKGFKTGMLINLAIGYWKDGYNVYYPDFENGQDALSARINQNLLECTKEEFTSGMYNKELVSIKNQISKMGGELGIDQFISHKDTMTDVELRLEELEALYGWKPDVIFYDYIDKAGCSDRSITQDYLKIDYNYDEAVRLNMKFGTFSFTQSQLKQEAIDKKRVKRNDLGRAFSKTANAHAGFSITQDENQEALGIAELKPVFQRDGKRYYPGLECLLRLDMEKQIASELYREFEDLEAWRNFHKEEQERQEHIDLLLDSKRQDLLDKTESRSFKPKKRVRNLRPGAGPNTDKVKDE